MMLSLKDQNRPALLTVAAANLAAYAAGAKSGEFLTGQWATVAQSPQELLPGALGLVIVGILNGQIDGTMKARLVFLKWSHPLPGAEAFTRFGPRDERVDMAALDRKFGPLPTAPAAQNSLWFKFFKNVESDAAVRHAHREYLFARDYHFLSALLLPALGGSAAVWFSSTTTVFWYIAALLVQFLMTGQAARNHGRRLVCTVLARVAAD